MGRKRAVCVSKQVCSQCNVEKQVNEFYIDKPTSRLYKKCIECSSINKKARYIPIKKGWYALESKVQQQLIDAYRSGKTYKELCKIAHRTYPTIRKWVGVHLTKDVEVKDVEVKDVETKEVKDVEVKDVETKEVKDVETKEVILNEIVDHPNKLKIDISQLDLSISELGGLIKYVRENIGCPIVIAGMT